MRKRVIIVDDDSSVLNTARTACATTGVDLLVAAEGRDAFAAVNSGSPTHVILDPTNRNVNALDLINQLAGLPVPPALILISRRSARLLEATKQAALAKGLRVVSTARKPLQAEQLVSLLASTRDATADQPTRYSTTTAVAVTDIRTAIRAGQIHYVYQPRIDCRTRALYGFEALARWRDIPPRDFIKAVEEAGLMRMLTRQLCAQGIRWLSTYFPEEECTLAINLSSESIIDAGLPEYLCMLCRHFHVRPARIILEVAEPAVVHSVAALEQVTRFRLKEFRVALDNAGAGYSSLEQLLRLPFLDLEIDRTFVRRMAVSEECRGIVDTMIQLAHRLGLVVTGKGVETQDSFAYLAEHGCDLAQGFHIAPPLEQHAAGAWRA